MKASCVLVICALVICDMLRVSNKVDIRKEIDNVEKIWAVETFFNKGRGIDDLNTHCPGDFDVV
jgi:hypothetical protein